MSNLLKRGDRVRYIGRREKYRSNGTVARRPGFGVAFWVEFDNGESGLFSDERDFVIASAVDQLAALVEERDA